MAHLLFRNLLQNVKALLIFVPPFQAKHLCGASKTREGAAEDGKGRE